MRADVRAWFDRRTYTAQQWSAVDLLQLKGATSVSVVLPARNEASTVGGIVSMLRRDLVDYVGLVDEVVVIDSGSDDATVPVAEAAGARVVRQRDALASRGDVPGKGEALWKSLAVTSGDVVVFVDADLRSFGPAYVVGLLGPLLADPQVHFVKAFYDRPLRTELGVMPAGGGRVTELVARPLLNIHWPQLSGFVQPLAGEYAARRQVLERLSFVSGYGVEVGMLIDVLEMLGLDGMAQVDLGCREHRNSSDAALGRMAAQVYLTVLSRLQQHGRGGASPATSLTQFVRAGEEYIPSTADVAVTERPPMLQVDEYRPSGSRDRA
jgi:glucosyl-3-phosphoglycerate synthase